jgi:hypothetical protein
MSLKDELLRTYDKDGNIDRTRAPVAPPAAGTPPADPTVDPTVDPTEGTTGGETKANTSGVGAMNDMAGVYENMISQNNAMAAKEQAAIDQYAEEQKKLQQEATDLTLQQMEQQKAEAADDYAKEQSAAYIDYQKQTAKHGVNAEQMASMGMRGTGYSESAKVAMYNAYQNRVAVARQTYNKLVTDYNNAMAEAKLQNSSALAQIAFNALQSGLQLNQQTLQNEQNLLLQKLNAEDQRNAQRAEILAATGDYSGYQALYGLTTEQAEALAASNGGQKYESIDSDELAKWETRFKTAGSVEAMKKIVEMMLANKISPDIAYGLYEMYKSSKEGTGNGVLGNIGNAVSGWFGNLFGKKDTNTEETGLEIKP